ncbi:skin secretory protein xP2-like isoform X1 [Brachypodium distachyon]|uniref:skin secretory protein xP2-like isoform X1 n=1 Tax=Brachypodium distachyon TaxID=15368 RepID=UPI000D0D5368|nr:skin secretory protein xP2-like isoform X1 [Brachypodium distachyon]|eukprot:XP_024311727.1 skin secretory protein xP2-like isoform X1 [Brachypodium distachyon]
MGAHGAARSRGLLGLRAPAQPPADRFTGERQQEGEGRLSARHVEQEGARGRRRAADLTGTRASSAVIAPADDPAATEVAPATGGISPAASLLEPPAGAEEEGEAPPASPTALQGPSAPAPGAGATVFDLDSDVEITGAAEESSVVPAPSHAGPATAAAVTTAAVGTAPGAAPAAADAAGTDSSAAQQGAAPAGGAAASPAPQSPGAVEGVFAEEGRQDAPARADDPPLSSTVAVGGFVVIGRLP